MTPSGKFEENFGVIGGKKQARKTLYKNQSRVKLFGLPLIKMLSRRSQSPLLFGTVTYVQQNLTNATPGQRCTVYSAVTSASVPPLISLNAVLQNSNISFLFYAPLVLNCCSRILTIISLSLFFLYLGDRLVKVNGQNILGKTYSQVMMLIQCRCECFNIYHSALLFFFLLHIFNFHDLCSENNLELSVLPKDLDDLQMVSIILPIIS